MVEAQLEALRERHSDAGANKLPSGAWLVTVPTFHVGNGWNQVKTTIHFIAPIGYPYANPDCFWADQSLRLASGGMPQASNIMTIPETNISGLWFSWHLTKPWNPNNDTLLNWLAVIGDRLRTAR